MSTLLCSACAHVLVVGRGCAFPALPSAKAGTEQVVCIQGSETLHMCKLLIHKKDSAQDCSKALSKSDAPLQGVCSIPTHLKLPL